VIVQDIIHDTRDGNQLRYVIERTTNPVATVVFLNGSFFNYHQWDLLVSRVSRKARSTGMLVDLLLMDYRGFSTARPLVTPFSFDTIKGDVVEILDRETVTSPIILVGASLGSLLGLALLADQPRRFSTLVAYGFAAPVGDLVRHVRGIFVETRNHLARNPAYLASRQGRLDAAIIKPVARALWDIFVIEHSRTPDSVKARGFTDAYGSFILKYMAGTPVSTIDAFLDHFTGDSSMEKFDATPLTEDVLAKVAIFQGEDDLVTPFPLVDRFSRDHGIRLKSFTKKGHTDYMLDGPICDAMAGAILEGRE